MSKDATMKYVVFDDAYVREEIKASGKTVTGIARELGIVPASLRTCMTRGKANKMTVLCLCNILGLDYERVTTIKPEQKDTAIPQDKAAGSGITITEINELVEIIVSYIQDVGKIQSDIIRELREMRTKEAEQLEKLNKTMHELDVYLRNEGAENRGFHKTVGNYLSGISSCMKIR